MVLGRSTQKEYLEQFYNKPGSQLIVMYGDKGMGKTTLLQEFMQGKEACYYQARPCSDKEQAHLWSMELRESGQGKLSSYPDFADLTEFIQSETGTDKKLVLIVDEFQHIVKGSKEFIDSMVGLLHHMWGERDALIILCSSCIGWVENSMVTRMGEAAFEISGFLKIRELSFDVLYEYFKASRPAEECISLYSILGGVPGAWKWVEPKKSFKENICNLFLTSDGALSRAARDQVESQLRETNVYYTILAAMASGSQKLNDLYHDTGFSRAKISVYLKNLMELEIVEKVFSFDSEGRENTQKGIYRISNHLVNFYFRFLYPHLSALSMLEPERFYDKYIRPELAGYVAGFFREICTQYLEQENQQEHLPLTFVKSGEWVGKMGSLDFVAQDEEGKTLIGGCYCERSIMPYEKYEGWMECLKAAKLEADEIYLFAWEGVDQRIQDMAQQEDKVHIVSWRKLYT